ncbi:CHAT domain-containing protein [Erythrobacter oryzae]|uniref:CHAT domain-containing protein n=1 Tax=Erythrobacter oryzae TaxID=3019556 RepID=UPI002555B9B7|nr:CHAT domain-containing protein [Erythrobacter sp. COR-2]
MVRLLALIMLLLASGPAPLAAQNQPDLAARFAADAALHVRDLGDLYSKRGVAPPRMERATLEDVRAFLAMQRDDGSPGYPEGAAVLFYAHHDDRLAIYLIDRTGLTAFHETAITPAGLRLAANYYRLDLDVDGLARSRAPQWIGEGAPPPPLVVTSSKASGQTPIADILLPPTIRTALRDVRHLVIVANGVIASTPFAAFPLTDDEMLIDRMSITVSAGLFDLDQMIRPWAGLDEYLSLLVVGDPRVPTTPDWRVPPLPGAAREAQMLAERVSAEPLLGEAATKAAVMERMRSARMLYFAAHGVSDPRDPLAGGYLMLAGPTREEAFLTAGEVQRMRLRADLVVLSACQSGLGYNHDAGVIGLARAFQKAGAPRVVMSLWSVSDEATLYLMDRFQLAAMQHMPAEALRLAMLDARKKYPEPALWAAFTLFGTPR